MSGDQKNSAQVAILNTLRSRVCLRAGRQAGRAICFTLLKVLCRILQNSAPGTTHIPVERKKRRPRTHNKARALFSRQCNSRSCTGLLMPFLPVPVPVPVPVLCGRLPHRAPLVLPARPRADKTTCYSPAPPTPWLVGSSPNDSHESRPCFPSQRQRTSTCEAT